METTKENLYIWDYIFNHREGDNMENIDIDVVQVLEEKKAYHLDQIKRINMALGALQGEPDGTLHLKVKPRRVQWVKEIKGILIDYERLTPIEIRNKLAEKGITQALDDNNKSSIYATLSRLVSKGHLVKTEEGKYGLPQETGENLFRPSPE